MGVACLRPAGCCRGVA